jgi:hypothetical protein
MMDYTGIGRSYHDTFVVVDRGDGHTTTLPKGVYIDADYRPSYDRLPILPGTLPLEGNEDA